MGTPAKDYRFRTGCLSHRMNTQAEMKNKQEIESLLSGNGFNEYKWIDPREIVVAHWVRIKCMFGCSDYGLGTCPPNTPPVNDCASFFKEYEKAILIRLTVQADKECYPSGWSKEVTRKLLDLERGIFLDGCQKVFLLNQTCCSLCKECPGNRVDCKDKTLSRPSPESFAVDVYKTVRNAGFEIHVIADTPSEIHRIAILLIE
jgi:predicted metal-binding protein